MKKPEDRYQSVNELIEDLKLVFEDTKGSYVGMAPFVMIHRRSCFIQKSL